MKITIELPEELVSDLIVLAGLDHQSSREVDLETIMQEALGDWIKKKAPEQELEPRLLWQR
jgi:hypothetical protein